MLMMHGLILDESSLKLCALCCHDQRACHVTACSCSSTGVWPDSDSIPSAACWPQLEAYDTGPANGVRSLHFSPDGTSLMALGKSPQHRPAILLWDISTTVHGGTPDAAVVTARHVSEVDVCAVKWLPFAPGHIVACGRDSVRLLRVKV